jgi:hypothetical protein
LRYDVADVATSTAVLVVEERVDTTLRRAGYRAAGARGGADSGVASEPGRASVPATPAIEIVGGEVGTGGSEGRSDDEGLKGEGTVDVSVGCPVSGAVS